MSTYKEIIAMKLPNLLIAGVAHAGTTSLFTYLSTHSEICSSTIKETHYFYPIMIGEELPPVQEYEKYFSHHKKERYIMEAGPGYLYGSKKMASLIKEMLGEIKIIFLLREPVARMYSCFKFFNKSMLIDKMSFHEFAQELAKNPNFIEPKNKLKSRGRMALGLDSGFYARYLQDWYTVFGEKCIKVVFFDDLQEHPMELLKDIYQWLSLDNSLPANITVENKGFYYRSKFLHRQAMTLNRELEPLFRTYPSLKPFIRRLYMFNAKDNPFILDESTKKILVDLYTPYNRQLYSLLKFHGYSSEKMPNWIKESNK